MPYLCICIHVLTRRTTNLKFSYSICYRHNSTDQLRTVQIHSNQLTPIRKNYVYFLIKEVNNSCVLTEFTLYAYNIINPSKMFCL